MFENLGEWLKRQDPRILMPSIALLLMLSVGALVGGDGAAPSKDASNSSDWLLPKPSHVLPEVAMSESVVTRLWGPVPAEAGGAAKPALQWRLLGVGQEGRQPFFWALIENRDVKRFHVGERFPDESVVDAIERSAVVLTSATGEKKRVSLFDVKSIQ